MDFRKKIPLIAFVGILGLLAFGWRPGMDAVDPLKVYHQAIAERPDLAGMLTNDATWNRCIIRTDAVVERAWVEHTCRAKREWSSEWNK